VSRRSRIPAASIVEAALVDWARKHGYPEPPER
jgi:hypothetical protein